MVQKTKQNLPKIFGVIVFLLFTVNFFVFAWQEPTSNPPGGNVYAPINTGNVEQIKDASIGIRGWDAVFKSIDNQPSPNRVFHLIGTYYGWDSEAIYIAGYNYYNPAGGDPVNSYAKKVHFGHPEKVTIDLNTGDITATGQICDSNGCIGDTTSYWTLSGTKLYPNKTDWNVGIGTTSPGAKLDVEGDIYWGGNNALLTIDQGGSIELGGHNGIAGVGVPYIDFHYNGISEDYNVRLINDANDRLHMMGGNFVVDGNVGIGTTSPNGKLQIQENGVLSATDGNLVLYHPSSGSYSSIVFPSRVNYGSDYGYIAYYDDNNNYDYWGGSSENSALVIGVQNDGRNSVSDVVVLKSPASIIVDAPELRAPIMYDQNNTGYYVDPNSTSRLYRIEGNYFFYSTSDLSLKKDIKPISNALGKISQLQGVRFNWKDTNKPSIGLIAQDVEKVFPEIVSTDDQGLKSLDYAKLVAPLIEATKAQQQEIEELKAEIEELKSKIK